MKKNRVLFISDFTIDNLSNLFKKGPIQEEYEILDNPQGSVISNLLNLDFEKINFCVVWTQPESIIPEFNHVTEMKDTSTELLYKSVDHYTNLLKKTAKKVGILIVPIWTNNPYQRGLGINDLKEYGLSRKIMEMNHRLINNLNDESNIFLLDTNRWLNMVGSKSYSPKLWYRSKVLFNAEFFKKAYKEILSVFNAVKGKSKKILFLDLDNTLWGGILGDDGIDNLSLGGHDELGEAYVDFQNSLLSLKRRGIILAIVSKNNENIALHAIENHPAMILKKDDFSSWRINWEDKAKNIIEILNELNLGSHSAVFLDDSPTERLRVKQAIPEVYVPDLPINPMLYNNFLNNLDCFDSIEETYEDSMRAEMYQQESQRKIIMEELSTISEWIDSLNIKIMISTLNKTNLKRAGQLLNKTNQMNLATRRVVENDFMKFSEDHAVKVLTLNVKDQFGDYGLTGILSLQIKGLILEVKDYVLSCRVLGRSVEESMIHISYTHALKCKAKEIHFPFIKTEKNNPCFLFTQALLIDSKTSPFSLSVLLSIKLTFVLITLVDLLLNDTSPFRV